MPIADEHVDHWFKHGYAVVERLFDEETVAAALADAHRYYPPWDDFVANRPRYDHLAAPMVHTMFPFQGTALSLLTVHPDLMDFVQRVTGIERLFMTQGVLWPKYPGTDFDQELHADYQNNTLLWPRTDTPYQQVPIIVYLTDVTIDLGPTHIVSKEHGELGDGPAFRSRAEHPGDYEHEIPVVVPAGSVLIHTMRTLHRGSAMRAKEGMRLTLHTVYRAAGNEFMGFTSFVPSGYQNAIAPFVEAATPRQRSMLGIPLPGDPYWTTETVDGVASRYPGWDMTPYRVALV